MHSELRPGHALQLLCNGTDYFPALERAIDEARQEIYLQTYIFENDLTGRRIAVALGRAARRGVSVRLLVDGFGSRDFVDSLMPQLEEDGVQVLIYRRELATFSLRRNRLRRLHRKVSVIDGAVGFVGGINVIDDMDTPKHTPPRYDYAVRIEGPILDDMHASCRRLWQLVTWASLRRRPAPPPSLSTPAHRGAMHARFVVRDNLRHRRDIEVAYLDAINGATREVLIANAYFLPGRRFRQALLRAAARGVKVTLLLQGRVEYALLHYATRGLYGSLLEGGVKIVEYHLSFLHAKVAVVDGNWVTVGSSNIDPFSLLLAREANIIVSDRGFAAELTASIEAAMGRGGEQLHAHQWRRRPWYYRSLVWCAYELVRVIMGVTGYLKHHR